MEYDVIKLEKDVNDLEDKLNKYIEDEIEYRKIYEKYIIREKVILKYMKAKKYLEQERARKEQKMIEIQKFIKNTKIDGIKRKLDELGRVVIPKNFREMKVEDGKTKVAVYSISDYVVIEILDNQTEESVGKKFDELGRVVIDREIRKELNWYVKDDIEIWNFRRYFILKKVEEKCVFCSNEKNLISYKDKLVCEKCRKGLGGVNEYV